MAALPEPLEPRRMLAAVAGQWPQFRGDPQLTGRSPLVGNIRSPEVLWEYDTGHVDQYLEVAFDPLAGGEVELTAAPSLGSQQELDDYWRRQGEAYDLDGNGTLTTVAPSLRHKIGDFLPDHKGLEMVRFLTVSDDGASVEGVEQLLRREAGEWTLVWETERILHLYQPKPIVGDFDADGDLEIAVAPHQFVHVYDMATGELEQRADFLAAGASSPRSYGWFGAQDLNGDGRHEFVLLGDFENFVSVLGWREGKLIELWDHSFEAGIFNKQTIHRPLLNPLADIDGDGAIELVTNIYNEGGSGRWEAIVFEGLTGNELSRLERTYLHALADLNGDSQVELLTSATSGQSLAAESIAALNYVNGQFVTLWSQSGQAFVEILAVDSPLAVNTSSSLGLTEVAMFSAGSAQRPAFLTQGVDPAAGVDQLIAWQFTVDGVIEAVGEIRGPNLEVDAARSDSFLLRSVPMGPVAPGIQTVRLTVELQLTPRAKSPVTTAIAGVMDNTDSRPTIVVQGSGERLHAIRLDDEGIPQPVFNVPGRGVFTGSPLHTGFGGFAGPVMANLLGNGGLQTVFATRGPDDQAQLQAVDASGAPLWSLDFDNLPGAPPVWNRGGLTTWVAGHFRDVGHDDLLVGIRRGTMHSEELRLVDGSTGEVIWIRTTAFDSTRFANRGIGGNWLALVDFDGDGLDEAVNFYPDVFTIIDGNGENLIEHSFNHDLFPGRQSFYATPVIADFMGDGTLTVYYAASAYETGLFRLDGTPIWIGPWHAGSPGILPAIGDFDGNGSLEIVSMGHRNQETGAAEARAVAAASGELAWTLPLPGTGFNPSGGPNSQSPLPPAVADVDGDGRDEAVFTIKDTLYVLGFDLQTDQPRLEWQMAFPDTLGVPALADVQGDGTLQILVPSTGGRLYGIGQPPRVLSYDVDLSGHVTLYDVLVIVTELRRRISGAEPLATSFHTDVNGDGSATLADALDVIQELRLRRTE